MVEHSLTIMTNTRSSS